MVDPAAAAHGVLLQGAQARQRLAGVEHPGRRCPRAPRPSGAVAVATPERWQARLSAVRSAMSIRWVSPATRMHHVAAASTRVPSGTRSVMVRVGAQHEEGDARRRRGRRRPRARGRPKTASPRASARDRGRRWSGRRHRRGGPRPAPGRSSVQTCSGSSPAARELVEELGGDVVRRRCHRAPRWAWTGRSRGQVHSTRMRAVGVEPGVDVAGPRRRRGRGSPRASASRGSRCAARRPRPARC